VFIKICNYFKVKIPRIVELEEIGRKGNYDRKKIKEKKKKRKNL